MKVHGYFIAQLAWQQTFVFYNPDRKKYNEAIAAQNLIWTSFFGRTNLVDF